jgi:NADH dehydrogenase
MLALSPLEVCRLRAWMLWLAVHIYYLTAFKNRLLVAWEVFTANFIFRRGARLIVSKEWRSTGTEPRGDSRSS